VTDTEQVMFTTHHFNALINQFVFISLVIFTIFIIFNITTNIIMSVYNMGQIYNWPPQIPDLKPIEHMWHQLKNHLGRYPTKPHTVEELEKRINIEWYKFPKEDCLKYIDSMPGRIEAVIKSKGQQTNY
jgi:hypothetical protein